MTDNLLLLTDSYKLTHWKQYPPKTTNVYSYFESRGGMFPQTVFFGLQYLLKRYLEGNRVDSTSIAKAKKMVGSHLGQGELFNEEGWNHIKVKHGGGLPISIKAVPEGTPVSTRNVLMTVENTDPKCYWLTNYLETLLVQTWYPTTVATMSWQIKRLITRFLEETGDPLLVGFKLHDFGFRGVSSVESAGIGGAAHLLNFMGTDTMAGLRLAQDYYGAEMAGFSIPAAEHSTITSWGEENEAAAFENMLDQYPVGLVAVVSDSYNIFTACEEIWGSKLREKVLTRDGTLVIRPDSGDPESVILRVLTILGDKFGTVTNGKGYKLLNPKVRIIQGDGVDIDSIGVILAGMKKFGWSTDNIAFGMGGGLLQKLHRDTQAFAFKCSSVVIDGQQRDVSKSPISDPEKNSKPGRHKLVLKYGAHGRTFDTIPESEEGQDLLVEVFRNGNILVDYNFEQCRANADNNIFYWKQENAIPQI